MIWLPTDLRIKWFGEKLIWDSNDLVVIWFEIQMIWWAADLFVNWFENQGVWWVQKGNVTTRDFLQHNQASKFKKRSFSARLPNMKLWSSKTKLLCETSFKNEALRLKNEVFLRDFLQKWSFETQKRSFSARLPPKMKLWSSRMQFFFEVSFKNETLKLKTEAFCARLPSKMICRPDTSLQNSNTL